MNEYTYLIIQDVMTTLLWRDMMWFEVRPATREWVVHTKKNSRFEDKFRFVTHDAVKIHAEAESYLDRFIRNYKLNLYEAEKVPDSACVQELLDEAVSFTMFFTLLFFFFLFNLKLATPF